MNPEVTVNTRPESTVNTNPIQAVNPAARMNPETYGFVSTAEILDAFGRVGWRPVRTDIGRPRKVENIGFQKHLIVLQNPDHPEIPGLTPGNKTTPQLVVMGSHDGTAALQLFWGALRAACLNGLIAGMAAAHFRLVHSKRIMDKVPEAIDYMLNTLPEFYAQVGRLQGLSFSPAALDEFIRRVYDARLDAIPGVKAVNYQIPTALRVEDAAHDDAYTVLNRVQERLIRGGIEYVAERRERDSFGNVTRVYDVNARTRKLSSVAQQVRLNKLVYGAAIELAA